MKQRIESEKRIEEKGVILLAYYVGCSEFEPEGKYEKRKNFVA